jgi:hypothetical protein
MRIWLLPVLALVAFACAPCHHRPHAGMMPCGAGSCDYRSECFSDGAIRSNDGVCQACSGGKWVPATGCQAHSCHECCDKKGKSAPCDHEHSHRKAER